MRDSNVARVRRLLQEAVEAKQQETAEDIARREFTHHCHNTQPGPVLDQSPRGRAMREILRISTWYGWTSAVDRALDAAGAMTLATMDDDALRDLRDFMRRLEDCVQTGIGSPEAPPAA